jgi:hypothetical protein
MVASLGHDGQLPPRCPPFPIQPVAAPIVAEACHSANASAFAYPQAGQSHTAMSASA